MRLLKRLMFPLAALVLAVVAAWPAQPALAAGETYTWQDIRTISITGPDIQGTQRVSLGNQPLTGDQLAVYGGNVTFNKGSSRGCYVFIQIHLFKTNGPNAGRIWSPPPTGSPGIGNPNATPRCDRVGQDGLRAALHDQWITINGTRPADPNAPEREEEKRFDVYVFAPDPLSRVPASDTIYIFSKDGTKVGELSSPFKDDSGAADWPPDQTPASLRVTFSLEPGDYVACDTYVAKECNYNNAPANQRFTKEKYKIGSIQLGKQFETPDKKRIHGVVEFHTKRPCGSTLNISPLTVELTRPDGTVVTQQTNAGTSQPRPEENGAMCTVNVMVGLSTDFENMPPGEYKACTTGGECVTFTKTEGQEGTFTLIVRDEDPAPPNEKVCTSGDGVAGALAWIICPAVQLIAGATEFFENNIIIPFMTVSPLTTHPDNPVYVLWQNFRDLANIGFVVLLFISIFSIALSKFGLKRALPRLLIVAVGINLSYFIVAFIIDAFNIFGAGISQLVTAALQQAGTTQLNDGTSAGPVRSLFTLGGAALLAIILSGGAAFGWLFSFIGLAALVVVVVVIVLIVRQLAIIVLVILSPVAILLYMLPNTESYFTKWRTTLIQLLMMYPMIVLLFAAGKIFGIILQQPDFNIAGDGVSEDVAQAVRVILQFLVYIIPLAFLPATFAASGALMGKAYAFMAGNQRLRKLVKRPGQSFTENVVRPRRQEAQMRAARRGGVIGWAAGYGARRDFKREQRERELSRARSEYLSSETLREGSGLAASAAGIGGEAGRTRAAAHAASAAARGRNEDLQAEMAMLETEMRRLGVDQTSFAQAAGRYFTDPTNAANRVLHGANGQTFDFEANETRLQRALLNSAASQGEVTAIEAARANARVDQTMLDDIIRRNDGTLKGKGGYHLATQFNLAAGRIQVHDQATGALRAPANQAEINAEIKARRLVAMAQTGANSIADMKSNMLEDTEELLKTAGAERTAVLAAMDHIGAADGKNYRAMLQTQIDQILANQQTLARSDLSQAGFQNIRNNL